MVTAFVRTILLYFIIMLGLRLMGKRQIGELEPTELVLTMLISDLAAVPMQDFGIPLLNGVVPIVTLLALSMLLSYGCMRSGCGGSCAAARPRSSRTVSYSKPPCGRTASRSTSSSRRCAVRA